jgi:uncharacterized protein
MDLDQTLELSAPIQQVWHLLLDPQAMASCVPGMKSIEVIGPDDYLAQMHVKIAFVSANFKLKTKVLEKHAPYYLRSIGTGEDLALASSLKQQSEIFLTDLPEQRTQLRMKVHADLLGRLGTFGLSVMKTKADRLWLEFGDNLQAALERQMQPTPPLSQTL